MAKRGARAGAKAADRQTSTKSKKPKTTGVVEVVEESGGSGIDAGIAIVTSLILLAAILFVDSHLARYDAGMFF